MINISLTSEAQGVTIMSNRLTLSAMVLLLLISGVNALGSSVDGVWAMELTDNISRHLDLELFQISMVIPSENGSDIISNKGDLVFGHGQITTETIPLTIVAGGFVHGDKLDLYLNPIGGNDPRYYGLKLTINTPPRGLCCNTATGKYEIYRGFTTEVTGFISGSELPPVLVRESEGVYGDTHPPFKKGLS
jgi:hypothetical protein